MKTKPLTFLLALTFLFLFSGSSIVVADDLQDGFDAYARKDYERFKNLYKQGAVSKRDFEKMKLMMDIRKKQVDMAKGMLKQAEAGLNRAKAQLKYAKVKSPIDGVVTMKMKKVAEMALPGYPVVVLSDINTIKAKSMVKESDADKFKIGISNSRFLSIYL